MSEVCTACHPYDPLFACASNRQKTSRADVHQRAALERILADLTAVQATFEFDSDPEGYIGEARTALALALGRHAP